MTNINIDNLTEGEALRLYHQMADKFGWRGTFFTREDAESEWQGQQYDDATGETPDTPMPDDVWDAVQNSWYWRTGLSDNLTEDGWELVRQAVEEATGSTRV